MFFVFEDLDVFVFFLKFLEDFERVVFGIVIDDDNFYVFIALFCKAFEAIR